MPVLLSEDESYIYPLPELCKSTAEIFNRILLEDAVEGTRRES